MKSLKSKSKLLVEQVLGDNFIDANKTLISLIAEAEENREEEVVNSLNGVEEVDKEVPDEEANTDGIDEPSDGSPNLGDSLDNSIEGVDDDSDQSVSEGEMTEMSNDVVEINCEINQKIISKLYDKISNLKTILNTKDIDHDTREFITLETKLSYYGNKLEELQSKTNPAIDQANVEKRIDIIDAALKSLEAEIGNSEEMDEIETTTELDKDVEVNDQNEESVDDLGDNVETSTESETETSEDNTESSEEGSSEEESNESEEKPTENEQE